MKKIYFFYFFFSLVAFFSLPFGKSRGWAQECNIIYVSPTGASSGVTGTRANPASLQYAFNLVSPTANRLWLATGTYTISIKLSIPDSVTIEGGFDGATWTKSNSAESIISRDNLNLSPATALIGLEGINKTAFRLQDLTITVANAPGNGNSVYGIYLNNCSNYNIVRCKVVSGDGSPGMDGAPGITGAAGGNGSNGLPACNENCVPAGGAGGIGVGGNNGGNGGSGARHSPNGSEIGSAGLSAGCGGAGGNGGDGPSCGCGLFGTSYNSSCSGSSPSSGQNGNAGTNGSSGSPGAAGTIVGGYWVPGTAGGNGTAGTSGCGGGGGGGGAGRQQDGSDDVGGSGGGGGGGGESGTGGTGGTGGGSSYAIFLVNNGTGGVIQDCDAQNGAAGLGGAGGTGGAGGAGGIGGTGGSGFGCGISTGANGGNGGSGGSGGSGGQGTSGESSPLSENGGTPVSVSGAPNVPGNPPVINANFFGCTNAEVIFSGTATAWNFGAGASPATATGNGPHSVYYSSTGRKTITLDGTAFTEYVDIFKSGPSVPSITPSGGSVTVGCPNTFSTSISGTNYQWIFGNNALPDTISGSSYQTADTVLFTSQGTYTVQLYVNTACCGKVRDTTSVTVTPSALNVAMTASPSTICQGDPATFTATPNTYLYYTFYVNNTVAQASTSNSFTTSVLAPGDSVMVIGFAGACFTNPSTVIYPTVNVIPSVSAASSDADNTICAGESVTFTASPAGYDNYEFFDGTTSLQSGTGTTFTTTALASGNSITIVATDNNCPSPASNAIVTIVNPLPVITLASSDVDNTICAGDNATFTASPPGLANYNFSVNGSSVQNGASNIFSSSSLANGNIISIVATSSAGCTGPVSNSFTFTVNPIPSVSLIATDDSICPGTNIIFTATPSGNDSYEFFDGTTSVQDSSVNSYSTTSLVNGNSITVIATDLGCSSPQSNVLTVYVYPAPSISLGSTDADSTICAGDTVTFTANPSGYNSYQFSINGSPVQTSASNTYTSGAIADNDVISAIAVDFGCPSLLSSISFSVNPFATVNAGTDATICAGSTHTLSGNIGGSATSSTWTTSGNGTFDNASSQVAVYTPSSTDTAAGNIYLILTTNDPDGSGPCPIVNDTVLLTINPEATVNAGADATICADTTQLLNGSIGGSATNNTWTTSGNGTFDNASSLTATYTPSSSDISSGNLTLTLTTDDPDGSGPCPAASDAIVLTINPVPGVSVAPSSNTICEDSSVTFTASPATSDSYQFFVNGLSVQNGPGNSYLSSTITSSDAITVIATDLGCVSLLSNAVSITVNPTPVVSLNVSDNAICTGDSVTFIATPPGYDNYMFVNGVNLLQNGASDSFSTTSLAPGNNITVIATNLGCPSPQSNAVAVTVNPLPVVSITQAQPFICKGDSATLTATVAGSAPYFYLWNTGVTINPINVAPPATTVYSVTVTDSNGCKGETNYSLTVIPPFFVDAGNNVFVCNNAGMQLSANAGFTTYQWSPAAGLSNPGISNPVANPDSATTYIVVVTDGSGCKNTDSVTVTPSFIAADAGADVTINYGQENPLAGSGGTQYQWSPSSGLNCADCQSPMASPLETTTYVLIATNADGCTDTDSVTVEVLIPTDVFVPDAFSPNGDGENDKLFVRGPTIAELSFIVYDRWGKKIFETTDKTIGWDGTFDGKNADAAVYVYVLYVKIVNGFEVKKKGDITLVR